MDATDKALLLSTIIEQIDAELATMTRIAREAAEAASHEENRAEGNKDMRSTEASYIARGQAERALELEQTRARLGTLELKSFDESSAVESTALVKLQQAKQAAWYLLLPVAGGRRLEHGGTVVNTITPTSPLGSALLGLSVGDEAEVALGAAPKIYEVLAVI